MSERFFIKTPGGNHPKRIDDMTTEQTKAKGSGREDLILTVYTNHQPDFGAPPGSCGNASRGTRPD
jgi:hypothetical protein